MHCMTPLIHSWSRGALAGRKNRGEVLLAVRVCVCVCGITALGRFVIMKKKTSCPIQTDMPSHAILSPRTHSSALPGNVLCLCCNGL